MAKHAKIQELTTCIAVNTLNEPPSLLRGQRYTPYGQILDPHLIPSTGLCRRQCLPLRRLSKDVKYRNCYRKGNVCHKRC